MSKRKKLKRALVALDGQGDIAAYLAAEGIRGVQADTGSCPVANYLTREVGVPCVAFLTARAEGDERRAVVPRRVFEFINDFDDGLHPELIA